MSRSLVPRRLRARLFASYLVVVASGVTVMLVVGAVVTRRVYDDRLRGYGLGRRQGRQPGSVTESDLQSILDESLLLALLAGTAAALAVAALVAWLLGRRLLRPLDQVGAATRRMASGDYRVKVPVPAEVELAALAHDVNELGDHLEATERRRSRLLGEVTHELRSPLTVISGHMEGLIDGVIDPSDEVFAAIAAEASRMQRLVDDLVVLSRAEEGVLELQLDDVDLGALGAVVAGRLAPQFVDAGVEIVAPGGAPVVVRGDADRLAQIVSNLAGNALVHTPVGGSVTLTVGTDEGVGWLEVVDTGSGIPVDEVEHIFERFYRLPGGHAAGRGLGLTIARGLARAHGGDLVARSDGEGTGAVFRLTVPLGGRGTPPASVH